ncbi:MAG: 50S ribosomal protein L9 [Bacteriovoracaceae bacterium]|jgi:large subunit ribosomal protein L9|nr:50S ribosomal protein L9 [Halobacteriovoraceae bacterium]MAX67676.1 50S ribosomal protein L9 [Halobacteriovoraceae bacterium]MDP7320301.1 50S ribosomal protein L9 [Bacteriovoracaceae bacterium]
MKVILTERVKSLGNIGEIVNVSEGFARNFLIPNRKAKLADEGNEKQMADYQKMLQKKVAEEKAAAEDMAKKVSGVVISLEKKIGGNGRLFGTVTNTELAKEFEKQGLNIEKRLITIEDPIKTLGEYDVTAKLFKGVEATFKVKVEIDPKQAEEMKKKQEAAAKKKAAKAKAEKEAPEQEASADEQTTEE